MPGNPKMKWLTWLIITISAAWAAAYGDNGSGSLTIIPDHIRIGTFYDGSRVRITANTDSCDGAVVVLEGREEEVELNRKGRVAIIWMNVAQIKISGLPQAYILAASDKLDNICSEETQEKLELGLKSLRSRMQVSSDQPLTGKEFDQFLKLKTKNRTYDTDIKIDLRNISSGEEELSAVLPIPSGMPPGNYDIELYCFKNGNMVEKQSASLEIDRIGLPHFMINLANSHAAMYGLLAIFVAMIVGIIMDFIFNSLPGSGH